MIEDPLHRPPLRPASNAQGHLTNAIGTSPFAHLENHTPIAYDDLVPSTTYLSHGLEYHTDASAMPARVRGVLRLVDMESRVRHDRVQRLIGQVGRGADDQYHGGHIVAVSLGGFASGPNLFPQAANFNVSAFARLEHSWRNALKEGCSVAVDIALVEGADPRTPSFLIVTHWEDEHQEELVFPNEGGAL